MSDVTKAIWIVGSFILAMLFLVKIDEWASPGVEIALVASIISFGAAIFYAGRRKKLQ